MTWLFQVYYFLYGYIYIFFNVTFLLYITFIFSTLHLHFFVHVLMIITYRSVAFFIFILVVEFILGIYSLDISCKSSQLIQLNYFLCVFSYKLFITFEHLKCVTTFSRHKWASSKTQKCCGVHLLRNCSLYLHRDRLLQISCERSLLSVLSSAHFVYHLLYVIFLRKAILLS